MEVFTEYKAVKNYGDFYIVKNYGDFLHSIEPSSSPPPPHPPTPKLIYFCLGGFSKGGWKGFLLANIIGSSLHLAFYTGHSIHF
jgi:hypothetical protein